MNKRVLFLGQALLIILFSTITLEKTWSQNNIYHRSGTTSEPNTYEYDTYKFPEFYRGIYLNIYTSRSPKKLTQFVKKARASKINALVMDVHFPRKNEYKVPAEYVDFVIKNQLHPIARIVVFPNGLKKYPVSDELIRSKIRLAESACKNGFKEIQFDYIRFNDSRVLKHLSYKERYKFIEGFLNAARKHLKKYNVKIAADVFGRIPLNKSDAIGQRMEGLDRVVDIICPMAYPSHYTWSKKLMANPYYTVLLTSKSAKERTRNADIVTYIQAFKMKLSISNMSFEKYIKEQLKAVHDAGIRGYLLWNASQKYDIPLKAIKNFYHEKTKRLASSDIDDKAS